jgi:hypothetical protein
MFRLRAWKFDGKESPNRGAPLNMTGFSGIAFIEPVAGWMVRSALRLPRRRVENHFQLGLLYC